MCQVGRYMLLLVLQLTELHNKLKITAKDINGYDKVLWLTTTLTNNSMQPVNSSLSVTNTHLRWELEAIKGDRLLTLEYRPWCSGCDNGDRDFSKSRFLRFLRRHLLAEPVAVVGRSAPLWYDELFDL